MQTERSAFFEEIIMKKRLLILVLPIVFLFTVFSSKIFANDIYSIDTEVEILEDGTGEITQVWKTYVDDGTEFFIPIENLNHMNLMDVFVSNSEREFEYVPDWDIDASFEEKAYKYGVLETEDGYEICFGMSQEGEQTYTIKFSYDNMLVGFKENDGFNVRFINDQMTPSPEQVTLKISSPLVNFGEDNSKIWTFGYSGNINFVDGAIVARNTSPFSSDNYLNVLLGVDKGIFSPDYSSISFEIIKEEAFRGSSYSQGDPEYDNNFYESIERPFPIKLVLGIIGGAIAFIGFIIGLVSSANKKFKKVDEKIKIVGKNEVPLNNNIPANYYFLKSTKIVSNRFETNLIVSYIFKWFKDGCLDKDFRIIRNPNFVEDTGEKELWDLINKEAVENGKILNYKLERAVEKNNLGFFGVSQKIFSEGYKYALENNLVENKKRFIISSVELTELGIEEYKKVESFYRYVNASSFMDKTMEENDSQLEKNFIFYNLYLNNKKTFKKIDSMDYNYYPTYSPFHYFLYTSSYRSSIDKGFVTHANKVSSGSGGGSSFGGGGGFSGGGSGGGAR